jgi:hypothetical protein
LIRLRVMINRGMKKAALVWIMVLACLCGEEQDDVFRPRTPVEEAWFDAVYEHSKADQELVRRYRAKLAEILKLADAVEIYRLNFMTEDGIPEERENDFFPIKPDGKASEILARKRLSGEELDECRKATAELLKAPDTWEGAYCHYPIHGLRFLKGKEVVFETSFCWKCRSYFVTFWDDEEGSASWCLIASDSIQKFLEKQLPIPQAELDRFDKDQGRGKPDDEEKK